MEARFGWSRRLEKVRPFYFQFQKPGLSDPRGNSAAITGIQIHDQNINPGLYSESLTSVNQKFTGEPEPDPEFKD